MQRPGRLRNNMSSNLRMKASSLHYLNDISNIDSSDSVGLSINWRDEYNFNPIAIGRGHFSKVYKVKCSSSGNTLAIKVIRRRRMGTDKIDEIMQEIDIMNVTNKSSNSGFIQLLKVHTSSVEVALVMEFASGGDLYNVMKDSEEGLPEIYVRIVLTKILSALSILHHQDIVHLDIKADNILLRHPYPSSDVAISDFGISRKLTKSKVHREMIGTPDYIAPEVINYEEISVKSDMWSVGVLTYFLLTNVSPFSGDSKDDTLYRVTKTEFTFVSKLTEEHLVSARTFINRLLVKVPQNRLSADECISHDFLSHIPVLECSSDRASITDVIVLDLDDRLYDRENSFRFSHALTMSQNDLDLLESRDIIVNNISTETCRHRTLSGEDDNMRHDMDEILCGDVEIREKKEVPEEDSDDNNSQTDLTTSSYEQTDSQSTFSDTTTETSNNSVLMKQDNGKENHISDEDDDADCFDCQWHSNTVDRPTTKIPKNPLISASFRNSRENIISDTQCSVETARFIDLSSCTIGDNTFAMANGYRGRSLIKCLKKNCDKPQLLSDKWSRRSVILSSENQFEGDLLSEYEFISASNPALATPEKTRQKKNYTVKFSELFKIKSRVKETKNGKVACVIS